MSNAVLLMHWGYRSKGKRDESMTGSSKEDSKFEQVVQQLAQRSVSWCAWATQASLPHTTLLPPLRVRSRSPGDVIPYLPLQGKSPGLLFLKCTKSHRC